MTPGESQAAGGTENVLSILFDELKAAAESRRQRPISSRAAG